MKRLMFVSALLVLVSGCGQKPPASDTLTERVEPVHIRTRLRHPGCEGFMESYGQPLPIMGDPADGLTRYLWPHKCDRCGATNTLFNVRYPQVKTEWRAVK